jgi:expansin (peptidoglycan-binding protein)
MNIMKKQIVSILIACAFITSIGGVKASAATIESASLLERSTNTLLSTTATLDSTQAWYALHSGYATFTGSGYSGGCALLDPIPSDMEITALNPADYNSYGVNAALAGAYLQVEGPKGSTIVYVTDLYPEGGEGALDLCPTSFAKIGDVLAGKIDIQWKVIKAPITGNVSYRIKEGSSPYWAAIQVRNHKYPVLKMEYYQNGQWINMEKMQWNHFVGTNMGTGTIRIRMTDICNHVITDTISALPQGGNSSAYITSGNVQFPD